MKLLSSIVLMATAFAGLVSADAAGWQTPSPPNMTVDALCANTDTQRVCFTTNIGDLTPGAGSQFSGFIADDKKSFVLVDNKDQSGNPAVSSSLVVGKYKINVNWNVSGQNDKNCAAVDIEDENGNEITNYLTCSGAKWYNLSA